MATEPVAAHNDRGVIAEHYHVLQSLGAVDAARLAVPFAPGTDAVLLVNLYQSVEIALFNLADLLTRAADRLDEDDVGACSTVLAWARSFHRLLIRLSLAALRVSDRWSGEVACWRVDGTPAYSDFEAALRRFDGRLVDLIGKGPADATEVFAESSLSHPYCVLLSTARVINHDMRVWSTNLAASMDPAPGVEPERLLSSGELRHAVREHQLRGDTYFTQFRALHQIPELLTREVNDRIEIAIRAVREGDVAEAVRALDGCVDVFDPIEACLPPIVDNMATSDYHRIRENLGLTSGSHSVAIHFHLFTDLYGQLVDELAGCDHALMPYLRRNVASLRLFILAWRDMHIHLPRNNLGGIATKSLTGSRDSIRTVRKMRDSAVLSDPFARLEGGYRLPSSSEGQPARYLDGPESSDAALLAATGRATQEHFQDVQNRNNFFAQRCPFTRPPRRVV